MKNAAELKDQLDCLCYSLRMTVPYLKGEMLRRFPKTPRHKKSTPTKKTTNLIDMIDV